MVRIPLAKIMRSNIIIVVEINFDNSRQQLPCLFWVVRKRIGKRKEIMMGRAKPQVYMNPR
jgi:hypothetical protein